ncbi:class I SAM-dependent methyltransferase [Salinibacter ruber]|uniref:class I SAM-dependent methyltransferase n=1 Tax=Salinibacter ruber TaxID=146919 RepID=UPI002072D8BD|nr:methyltransferase domain-containing protein [Salinibacter ruber]
MKSIKKSILWRLPGEWRTRLIRWKNHLFPNYVDFDDKSIKSREKFRSDYRIVANSLSDILDFYSVLDVGCAQGFLIEPLHEEGFHVEGIEVSDDVVKYLSESIASRVTIGDFSEADGSYDLVCCVEVAEHIEPARSEELVEKLCSLSSEWIYFTAAMPGQGGHGHINCRPHEHWIQWFEEREWFVRSDMTRELRQDLEEVKKTYWIKENSLILSKKQA